MIDKLRYGDRVVQALRSAVSDGEAGLRDVPDLIEKVIQEKLWLRRAVQATNETIEFASFTDFIRAMPPEGLGADFETLLKLCEKNPRVLDLIDRATIRKRGGDRKSNPAAAADTEFADCERIKNDNVTFEPVAANGGSDQRERGSLSSGARVNNGNSKLYALRRLRHNHRELHQKVLAGEMSAHRAMIAAGFRRETVTVPLEPQSAAQILAQKFDDSELRRFLEEINKHLNNLEADEKQTLQSHQ